MVIPVNKLDNVIGKVIVDLGKHLLTHSTKTNLQEQFSYFLKYLQEIPVNESFESQKQFYIKKALIDLDTINNMPTYNKSYIDVIEKKYQNLFHELINIYLWISDVRTKV